MTAPLAHTGPSLGLRFILLLLIAAALTIALTAVLLTSLSWSKLRTDARQEALLLLSCMDWAVAPLTSKGETASIQRLLENIGGHPEVKNLRLYGSGNLVLASNRLEELGERIREPTVEDVFAGKRLQAIREDFTSDELSAAVPVHGGAYSRDLRTDVDKVLFLRPDIALQKRLYSPFTWALVSAVSATLIAMIASFLSFVSRWIMTPLRHLSRATAEVSGGNYEFRAPTNLPGELGGFANLFNSMLEEIGQKNRDLREHAHNLEDKVEERTRFIWEANKELERAYDDLNKAQSRLLQSEKMASIGQLAAGVAHEINNPNAFVMSNLTTLGGYMEQLRAYIGRLEAGLDAGGLRDTMGIAAILEDLEALRKESLEGTQRVESIVRSLRDFAHADKGTVARRNVNELLEGTLRVIHNEIKYKGRVEKDYREVPEINCYPQRLQQVFLNLLVNAAQAIESNGVIGVSTGLEDEEVVVRVRDNGYGIPKELQERVFEPFFTTKDIGKGTGLGLSIAYDIIQDHKGRIEVESAPGKGTEFTIRLPVDAELEEE